MFLDHVLLQNPALQANLDAHRHEQAPCVFCQGVYHTPIIFYDPNALYRGYLVAMIYNVCESYLTRDDFPELVDAEYRRDLPRHRAMIDRKRNAWLN